MGLAECAIAKTEFEKNKVSEGFEALARAQDALESVSSLSLKMSLLSQIDKAKMLCECLAASEGVDLKFEEALCSFLLGQGAEKEAVERLRELKSSSGLASQSFVPIVSQKEVNDGCPMDPSLEIWLKDAVLGLFPDTRCCSPTLANFLKGERKILRATKNSVGIPRTIPSLKRGSPSFVSPPNQAASEETVSGLNSSGHLAAAVNQPANTRNLLTTFKMSSSDSGTSSVQLKRKLEARHNKIWKRWTKPGTSQETDANGKS